MIRTDQYVHGYATASQTMALRTADNFATFFTPYISPGMTLLDVGCGPGTITVGLASKVNPGKVVGIDIGSSEVARATDRAKSLGLTNAEFEVMDATSLQFKDGQFDAVFSCMALEHIPDAAGAVREIARVLKPGGVVGLKGGLVSRAVIVPETMAWRELATVYLAVWKAGGGHPEMGLEQLDLVKQAGLAIADVTGFFETRPARREFSERLVAPSFVERAVALGVATREQLQTLSANIEKWEQTPGAFMLPASVQVIARKPG